MMIFQPSSRLMVLMIAALLMGLAVHAALQPAIAQQYQSRLNGLLLKKSSVYLPSRLVLGQDNRLIIKAQPGSTVKVFVSPEAEGFLFNESLPLQVGSEPQELSGIVPENGVLELTLTLPDEAGLEGKMIYMDAVVGKAEDFSDFTRAELLDASGRRTTANGLVLAKPAEPGHALIAPMVPGLDPQLINQLSTLSDIYAKDDQRRKELLMNSGDINRDAAIDQNSFNKRGLAPGVK